jgi:hypothetical protein
MAAKGLWWRIARDARRGTPIAAILTRAPDSRRSLCYHHRMKTLRVLLMMFAATLPVGARLGIAAGRMAPVTAPRPVLPFIEDDYTRAVSEARARKLPIFIEAWAPW